MQALTFFLAFVAVLALIGVAAWLVRRFASSRLGANTNRGRMPRLAVIDAAAVDGRRRLVLVRRDNTEHLLMIGGPTDIVVEANIVRAMPGRDQVPPRPGLASPEPQVRVAPAPEPAGWVNGESHRGETFEHGEPQMPEPPPRPVRPSFADEARRGAPERRVDRGERSDGLTGFAPEPISGRAEPRVEPAPPRMPRTEPLIPRPARETAKPAFRTAAERAAAQPQPPPPQAQPPMSAADQNLAEMAQRLEAALRRPATDQVAPPVAPEPPPARTSARGEPPAPPPAAAPTPPPKSGFENLEDEMASLLGRPKNLS